MSINKGAGMEKKSIAQYHEIRFVPGGRVVKAADGESLIEVARKANIHINSSCGGAGVCGKCRILLENGEVDGGKSEKLSSEDFKAGYRLACLATVKGNLTIRLSDEVGLGTGGITTTVPERHRAAKHIYDIDSLKKEGIFEPPVKKYFLDLPRPCAEDNMADSGRVIQGLKDRYNIRGMSIGLTVLRKMRRALRDDDFKVTVTLVRPVNEKARTLVVNIQSGDWTERCYGLAMDIGTTTVNGKLVDLRTGEILVEEGDYNKQLSYGEDVISRVIYAEKPKGLELMQELVVTTINGIIDKLLLGTGVDRDEITSITIAGNTVMTHLLLALEPHSIRRSPYVPVSTFFPSMRATDIKLNLYDHTVALLYPSISSYVGGDIVAGVMGSGMYRTNTLTLYLDVGTNAEIVIGNREWLVCAACSAGPAFEGGGITFGMRAAKGAIEDFGLNPVTFEPMNVTIGKKPPLGICGSGLLIIVATLFEHGLIDQRGKFNRNLDTPRIRKGVSGYEYVLAWKDEADSDRDIVINEVDIDNFIRAKAAIYAGCKTLVEEVGLQVSDLEQIILAGAFGSFIDLDSAMTVGLLPEVDPDKVMYVGNGSLMGCRMSGISNHIRQNVVDVVRKMTSFELSEVTGFHDQYVGALFLPHTEASLFPRVNERLSHLHKRSDQDDN